jgi:hypothetical protein
MKKFNLIIIILSAIILSCTDKTDLEVLEEKLNTKSKLKGHIKMIERELASDTHEKYLFKTNGDLHTYQFFWRSLEITNLKYEKRSIVKNDSKGFGVLGRNACIDSLKQNNVIFTVFPSNPPFYTNHLSVYEDSPEEYTFKEVIKDKVFQEQKLVSIADSQFTSPALYRVVFTLNGQNSISDTSYIDIEYCQ